MLARNPPQDRVHYVKQIIVSANLNLLKQASESKSSKSVNQMFRQSIQKHNRGLEVIRMDFNGNVSRKSNSFDVQVVEEFNNLPKHLRSPTLTSQKFKILLKKHILTTNLLVKHNNHTI